METKEKTALERNLEYRITSLMEWLAQVFKAQALLELLPPEIKTMNITDADCDYSGNLTIYIEGNKDDYIKLKTTGIQGLKPRVVSYSTDKFYAIGEGVLPNGTLLKIHINNIPQPDNCHIETKETVYKENVLVCDTSGKEI